MVWGSVVFTVGCNCSNSFNLCKTKSLFSEFRLQGVTVLEQPFKSLRYIFAHNAKHCLSFIWNYPIFLDSKLIFQLFCGDVIEAATPNLEILTYIRFNLN